MASESGQTKKRGGSSYHVTDEQILRWQARPPNEKLQWREDANRFLAVALAPAACAIQESFRRGDL